MAYTTVNKRTDFSNTALYTGNASTQSITGIGHQPDFTWIKRRDGTYNHYLFDAVRGAGKYIKSNQTAVETDGSADHLTSWASDGFNLGSTDGVNASGDTFASWNWKAGTTSGIATNGSTTITPSAYSFNQTAGFSIIKYTGNDTAGAKVPHGLGAVPKLIIIKSTASTNSWNVYHAYNGATKYMLLDSAESVNTNTNRWNDTEPDSVNFTLGSTGATNGSGGDSPFIAYCFAEVRGYSKFSNIIGNGYSGDGTYVYTGFKPSLLIIKRTDGSGDWMISDNKRSTSGGGNVINKTLVANTNQVEIDADRVDFLSNGFKLYTTDDSWCGSTDTAGVYMAWGQTIVGTNNVPATG
tara:strand:+ start:957 stop:2015 length:1059 start_codon:yes stop_codon:yes gene_type:complete